MRPLLQSDLDAAARRWSLPGPLVRVATTPSTMDDARELADEGALHGTAVVAEEQTAGRGRLQRSWSGRPGSLALTVILRPSLPTRRVGCLSLAAAVALRRVCGERFGIKWPNDLLGPDGRKVAGIRSELEARRGAVQYVLVGIGLNLDEAPSDVPEAACLADYTPTVPDRAAAAAQLTHELIEAVARLESDPAGLLAQWKAGAVTLGQRVQVGGTIGEATGITTEGALTVLTDDGAAIVVHAGDVRHIVVQPSGSA